MDEFEFDKMFDKLCALNSEWMTREDLPSLSEFIQSSVILVRKSDNRCVAYFPGQYDGADMDRFKSRLRLPNDEDDPESKRFGLCESQYEFQMWGLKLQKDVIKLNKKEITEEDFKKMHPDVKLT